MSKPLLLPEPYGGKVGGWAEWVDHFENVATVNKWATGEEKLKWLKVRLPGKAQTAFKKLPQDVKEDYGECMKSLQRRFDPDNKRQLYVAELSDRTRHKDEDWATFGDVLRVVADEAYPDLEEKARERLALNQFLAQIENAQVAFGVKQKRPTNVEEAVVATIELESYLGSSGKPLRVSAVSPQEPDPDVRVRRADRAEAVSPLDEPLTVKLLGERLQRLEMLLERQGRSTRHRTSKQTWEAESGKRKAVVCWTCGKKGHIARFCRSRATEQHQGNFSPSVERAYHDVWTQLVNRDSTLVLEQWSGKKLVVVNGALLSICGCGFKGTPFMVTCIVTDDITIEAILGLDFLEANSCVIDCGQKVLTFPSQKLSIPFLSKTTTEQGVATVGLVLKEKIVVPAGSEMEVMVKIAGPVTNSTWVVGHKSATCNGVMVANAVVSPSSNVVPVRILNPRDEMVVLKKGTQIASMELLEQDPVINISTVMKNAEVSLECQNILWDLVSKVGSHISESEREQLYSLLVEFADVFSFSSKDLGRTKELKHHIFTSDAQPVHLPPRRIPQARREELRGLLRDMLESDVIQQSDSPWSSPIVLAKKHDGTARFCVDYRKVNEVTRKDAYPLPRVDDTLDTLVGSKFFTTLDLASGYWQVEVAPEDQPKTAFTTPEGLYQFKQVTFLGHIVSTDGVATDPSKTEAVSKWPIPQNRKEVQQFLGLANYYRRFVKDFALISKLLQRLTEKNAPFEWTIGCQNAFDELRKRLVSSPVLAYPDYERRFILDTDASDVGIGAVLSQVSDCGSERVIAYASRSLTRPVQRQYLLGREFTLRTDHGSLVWIRNFKEPEGQLARWLERLQEYNLPVVHRQGLRHCNADALSRVPCRQCEIYTPTEMRQMQQDDTTIQPVHCAVSCGQPTSPDIVKSWSRGSRLLMQHWDALCIYDGILWKKCVDGSRRFQQLVLPAKLQVDALRDLHQGAVGGHIGEEKMKHRLKERFYWPGCTEAVGEWCRNCISCTTRKTVAPKRRAPLQTIKAGYPMQIKCMLYGTRRPQLLPKKLVDEMFCRFSPPEQLHSDQGRQFESDLVKEICELLQIRKTRTTPYHPQCNGMVERFNWTLLDMLSTAVGNHQADWQQHIRKLCLAYNSSVHSSTGFTPFFLMFGRQAKLPIDLMYGTNQMEPNTTSEYARCLKDALQEAYALVRERCQAEHKRQKELYDQKVHGKPFSPGELVWLHSTAVPRGRSRKLHHPWKGPFKVMEQLGETTYKIKNLQGRRKTTFVHFDRLKPCVISDDKPENTGSREQEPVGTNLDLVDSDDNDPVQQEEAAVPEIANPPVPHLNEQCRYPVRDRQRTKNFPFTFTS
eukprot:Em0042g9a